MLFTNFKKLPKCFSYTYIFTYNLFKFIIICSTKELLVSISENKNTETEIRDTYYNEILLLFIITYYYYCCCWTCLAI